MINEIHKCHLFYIIENNLQNDKYSGLSHVAEHVLLIPSDIGRPFAAKGYTCANHVYLSFSSNELTALTEVDDLIMSMQVLTDDNVSIAKEQVKREIKKQMRRTTISCQIVNFVTEGRITKHAMGELAQIEKIQTSDVLNWFSKRVQSDQVHRYLFNNEDEIIVPMQNTLNTYRISKQIKAQYVESSMNVLYLFPSGQINTIRIYFKIPSLTKKIELIKKGLAEYCTQRRIAEKLGIDVNIYDQFFDTVERYVVMEFAWNRGNDVDEIVRLLLTEMRNICKEDYMVYKTEFINMLIELHPYKESAHQIMNAIKNNIVYAYPKIEYEDFSLIDQIDYVSFLNSLKFDGPIKIVAM